MTTIQILVEALWVALGKQAISVDIVDKLAYSHDTFPLALKKAINTPLFMPDVIAFPKTAAQVAAIFNIARAQGVPLVPYGGGSGIVGGALAVHGGIAVDLKLLAEIGPIDKVSQLVSVGAGVNGQRLEDYLNERGYTTGHYPQSLRSSTVGGWIAHRAIGTASTRYGGIEALVAGMEIVLPSGELVDLRAHPRSSTGPDYRHLFLGSEGTLGIVTQATLRLRRLPETRQWSVFTLPTFNSGLDAIRHVVQSDLRPAVVRLYDAEEGKSLLKGAGLTVGGCLLIVNCEGYAEQALWESEQVRHVITLNGGSLVDTAPAHVWWNRRFFTTGLISTLHKPAGIADALEVAGSWRDLPQIYASMLADMQKALSHPAKGIVFGHLSHAYLDGGNLYMIFLGEAPTEALVAEAYNKVLDAALTACLKYGGTISHHHGIGLGKLKWIPGEYGAGAVHLLESLKAALDPDFICNPGKLGDTLNARVVR